MLELLTDLSQAALAKAAQSSLHAHLQALGRSSRAEFHRDGGLARWHTRIPHPWFNGVFCARPPGEDERETILEAERYFHSRQTGGFTWWVDPGLRAADWAQHLEPLGFHLDNGTPGMAAALDGLDFSPLAAGGFHTQRVENLETLRNWAATFCAGYGLPADWGGDFYDLLADQGLESPFRHYLGYWQGQPAATSTLFLGAGVAGVYNVSTLEYARGRGFGGLLTLLPLQEAAGMGYRAGVLQSSEMGFHLYRRLGFQKVCDVTHFYYRGLAIH